MAQESDGGILEAALDYRERGWSVVPVVPRAKRPLIRWQPFQEKIASEEDIRAWYRRTPEANVSIVTGALSGLVVLDVDPRHGGAESLTALTKDHGALPRTMESKTGGGGRHLYFRHPGGELRNRAGLAAGLDVRGDGGVIVAPPSIHPSGKPYRWRKGRGPGEAAPAEMPTWLVALCRGEAAD
jgi:hypothetical protein